MDDGWQEKGKTRTCKSCDSKQVNVWGLMNRKNKLCYQIVIKDIKMGKVVINFLDKFITTCPKKKL